jgi:peptide/nickel transport system permease protein
MPLSDMIAITDIPRDAATDRDAWPLRHAFKNNRMALFGTAMLACAVAAAVAAQWIAPYDPAGALQVTIDDVYAPPNAAHWLGTDDAGRDVLTNLIYGARVSLTVGFFASVISVVIGGTVGMLAGFLGGRTESVLMRFTDVVLVIPDLPLAIVLVALTSPGLINVILAIGIVGWTGTARLVRSHTLSVKQRGFVIRAHAVGAGNLRILIRHIFPFVLPLIAVNTVLVMSLAILNESTLSFLGLSDPSRISWGQMLNFAFTRGAMSAGAWWALVPPGAGIVWVVLGCSLLGYGLEHVFNPRTISHHLSAVHTTAYKDANAARQQGPDLASFVEKTSEDERHAVPGTKLSQAPVVLEARRVSVDFTSVSGLPAHAVEDVSFVLHRGEMLGVVGESGCGKTTLMLSLLRLLPAAGRIVSGEVLLSGKNLLALDARQMADVRWKEAAVVFQGAMNALNPIRTVGDQIAEAILRHEPNAEGTDRRVCELFEMVGLASPHRHRYPHQYSGGMRQRAMIAMALACSPRVLLADEPTTALDVMVQAQILNLLDTLRRELGLAVVLVTHDLGVVAEVCQTVLVMYGGVAAEYAHVDALFNRPQHPYTRELLKAFPDLSRPEAGLVAIPGSPPSPSALPPGCRFAPRCPDVSAHCLTAQPALHVLDGEHWVRCHLVET